MIQETRQTPASPAVVSGVKSAIPVPAATVQADTGALPAGDYRVEITMGFSDAAGPGKGLSAEHRNAANSATVSELGLCPSGSSLPLVYERVTVAANERIRVISQAVAGAALSVATSSIRAYLLRA